MLQEIFIICNLVFKFLLSSVNVSLISFGIECIVRMPMHEIHFDLMKSDSALNTTHPDLEFELIIKNIDIIRNKGKFKLTHILQIKSSSIRYHQQFTKHRSGITHRLLFILLHALNRRVLSLVLVLQHVTVMLSEQLPVTPAEG